METKKFLIIIIAAAVLIPAGLYFLRSSQRSTTKSTPAPLPVLVKSTPTPISKPAPVTMATTRGILVSVSNSEVTINSGVGIKTFNIQATKDFQKITSGTIEGGDAKTAPSSPSQLKIGQEIIIITPKGSTIARSVIIIK